MNVHTPDDKKRGAVRALAAARLPHQKIATYLDIKSVDTLKRHYEEELREGRGDMIIRAIRVVDNHLMKNDFKAAEFVLKSKIGDCGPSSSVSVSSDSLKISIQEEYEKVLGEDDKKDDNKDDDE